MERSSPRSSRGRALAAAVALAILGPVTAFVLMQVAGLAVALLGVGLSVVLAVVLTLVIGQYLAFGGLSAAYLAWRDLGLDYLGVRVPSLRDGGVIFGGYLLALALGIGGSIAVSLLVTALGMEAATNPAAERGMENPEILPLFVVGSILVIGPAEEVLFRGVIQSRLREAFAPVPAIVLASVLFAGIHAPILIGPSASAVLVALFLVFPALVFGAAYEYTGNVVVPALIHGLYNATLFTLLYVFVTYDLGPPNESGAGTGIEAIASLPPSALPF